MKMLLLLMQTRIISVCFKQPTINPMFKNAERFVSVYFSNFMKKVILEKVTFSYIIKEFSVLNDLECSLP